MFSNFTRDYVRTPMQWTSNEASFSGFMNSSFKLKNPWLPINKNFKMINVEVLVKYVFFNSFKH